MSDVCFDRSVTDAIRMTGNTVIVLDALVGLLECYEGRTLIEPKLLHDRLIEARSAALLSLPPEIHGQLPWAKGCLPAGDAL